MSDLINVSICLSDIPKEKIKQASNGKKYLNVAVARRREVNKFGQTHTVYVQQSKEEREANENRSYLGSGKEVVFGGSPVTAESVDQMPPADDHDDLPF